MKLTIVAVAAALLGMSLHGDAADQAAHGPAVAVSFPATSSATPLDGRIILLLSRDFAREPRSHVEPNEPLASPYLFGMNVAALGARPSNT